MRLTLVISQLGPGGAERILSTMANYWADHEADVTLITLGSQAREFFSLSRRVCRRPLDLESVSMSLAQTLLATFRRIHALRRGIAESHPEVVVSFLDITNVLTIAATRGFGVPVIVSERIDPSQHDIGRLRNFCRRVTYRFADAVVVQSEQAAAAMNEIALRRAPRIIPNFALSPAPCPMGSPPAPSRTIVSVGSLTPRKQVDALLRAFAKLIKHHQDWHLVVVGEGPERGALEALAKELGITSKVTLLGLVSEPERILQQADLFALTSRYEGFPNVLLEAMACGLPVVSFDCPSGPRAIIRHEIDGLLVPDQDLQALTVALDRLMSNPEERKAFGRRAREVTLRFGIHRVMAMWDNLIAECVQENRSWSSRRERCSIS